MRDKIDAFVKDCRDLEDAAARLGVRPSTLRKVLAGTVLSPPAEKNLVARLGNPHGLPATATKSALRHERLQEAHRLYRELGTLEAVGQRIGVTRERVRQLLVKGSGWGLFEYHPREYPYLARKQLLADYRRHPSVQKIARANHVPDQYVRKLLTVYGITRRELRVIANKRRKGLCVVQYGRIVDRLGHHPSTTELQSSSQGHSLHARINRLWGSIDTFREILNVPPRPKGNPHFREHVAPWREHQRRVGFVVKMQQLDDMRDYLRVSGSRSALDIAEGCRLNSNRARVLLGLLLSAEEIEREGTGAYIKYRLRLDAR